MFCKVIAGYLWLVAVFEPLTLYGPRFRSLEHRNRLNWSPFVWSGTAKNHTVCIGHKAGVFKLLGGPPTVLQSLVPTLHNGLLVGLLLHKYL